jgi:hypothetical protein
MIWMGCNSGLLLEDHREQDQAVALTLDESVKRYNEFNISNKVRERGWVLSAYSMPPDAQEINSLRIVMRPHLKGCDRDPCARYRGGMRIP